MSLAVVSECWRAPPGNVLIAGVGNVLLGDDGLGVHVARMLIARRHRLPSHVEVIDAGLCFLDLLPSLPAYGSVVVVDALRGGGPPGAVYSMDWNVGDSSGSAGLPVSQHEWNVSAVLTAAERLSLLPARLLVLGAEPGSLESSLTLSPPAGRAARRITAILLRMFRRHPAEAGTALRR